MGKSGRPKIPHRIESNNEEHFPHTGNINYHKNKLLVQNKNFSSSRQISLSVVSDVFIMGMKS